MFKQHWRNKIQTNINDKKEIDTVKVLLNFHVLFNKPENKQFVSLLGKGQQNSLCFEPKLAKLSFVLHKMYTIY